MMNQTFYTFYFIYGDKINLDVHPFAGSVGLDGCYDCHPGFSAWLMTYHKYAIFGLLSIFLFTVTHPIKLNQKLLIKEKEEEEEIVKNNEKNYNNDESLLLVTLDVLLFFSFTSLGVSLMIQAVTRHHPFEQGSAMGLLIGTFGIVYSFCNVAYLVYVNVTHGEKSKKSSILKL